MMNKKFAFFFYAIALVGFSPNRLFSQQDSFNEFAIDTILQDKISIRSIIADQNRLWYAADKGRYGYINLTTNGRQEFQIKNDTLVPEFRSIAQTSKYLFLLNVGNPALLYRIDKNNNEQKLIYTETGKKTFYDSMQFSDDRNGIAVGDPTNECFSIIVTHDGGNSWQKIPCTNLPKLEPGEAAFAASNTNIVIKGHTTWIASGGKQARVFYSSDDWKTWRVSDTPIVHGLEMTGIFSADFYDEKNGFIAGGNYEVQNQNFGNKAITDNGGKTWRTVAENAGFGYASCVQYVPNGDGRQLVTVGGFGLQYSEDSGQTWAQVSDDKDLYTIRFVNDNTALAAGRNKIIRIRFK